MLFKIISNVTIQHILKNDTAKKSIIIPYEKALELYPEADYFNPIISEDVYWTNNLEEFINDYFHLKGEFEPVTEINFQYDFCFSDEINIYFISNDLVRIIDLAHVKYFNLNLDLKNQIDIEKVLRTQISNFSIEELKTYCHENNQSFSKILVELLKTYNSQINFYVDNIIEARRFLNKNKIYNFIPSGKRRKDDNQKIYSIFEYTDSLSGRLYCKDLQTLSEEDKKELEVTKDSNYLVEFDFSAFEYNILSDLLGLEKVDDPHTNLLSFLGLNDVPREVGKKINYSYLYGMSLKKICTEIFLAYGIKIDEEKLSSFPIFANIPDINIKENILTNYFGRRIKIDKTFAALNYYIQSIAADIFFYKFIQIVKIIPNNYDDRIILQNHDSILFQFSEKTISQTDLVERVKKILEQPIDIFTFRVSMKFGRNYLDLI